MASLEEITTKFRKAVGEDAALGRSVKFVLKGDGVVRVDGSLVSNDDLPADLTLTLSRADLEALGEGRINPMTAVLTGRLKVSDMAMAMQMQSKLQALFDRVR
ncbi:SCP2 sterol-binding domain-containing protein [Caulobacter sp. S45]|uniref:SCP2 sterol-binding domain-containing protein n=1 Tax=Caulobacter sp. S45 TaxID=1641861 RepID=UPI0015776E30|nr:SCP2 sterol-binding domain-containing protein [Caulobacter sp. S45]